MNKAAAVGFAAGMLLLGFLFALNGLGNGQSGPRQTAPQAVPYSQGNHNDTEEAAESELGGRLVKPKKPALPPGSENTVTPVPDDQKKAIKMSRIVSSRGYRSGEPMEITVSLEHMGGEKVTALALVERLPKGWSFVELANGAKPVIVPARGATGELSFVWVQVPAFPCLVSYKIAPDVTVSGQQELDGQAVYRQFGPEVRTEPLKSALMPASP